MGWPQYTLLWLNIFGLGIALAKDGEPRGNHSFAGTCFGTALLFALLYAGGFFEV